MDDLLDLNMNDLINEERGNLNISNEELITINNWRIIKIILIIKLTLCGISYYTMILIMKKLEDYIMKLIQWIKL